MNIKQKQELIAYLSQYATPNKLEKMARVLPERTKHVSIVLEDIFQQHNASAVIRSAECFGIQDIHVVETQNKFTATPGVAMGSSKWIHTHRYTDVKDCYKSLKEQGFRVVAASPHVTSSSLYDLPYDKKMALVFGTEHVGLSQYALDNADEYVAIPMYGFTESFNVSVSVAVCLFHLIIQLRNSDVAWQLTEQQQLDVMLDWLRAAVRGSAEHENYFLHGKK